MTSIPFGVPANPMPNGTAKSIEISPAEAEFMEYFVRNYPGPDTIIFNPRWHAPKIFRAARHALTKTNGSSSEDGWLPIETAPKDGTVILGVTVDAQRPRANITWFEGGKWLATGKPEKFMADKPFGWWPTHWRLLPAAPTRAAS